VTVMAQFAGWEDPTGRGNGVIPTHTTTLSSLAESLKPDPAFIRSELSPSSQKTPLPAVVLPLSFRWYNLTGIHPRLRGAPATSRGAATTPWRPATSRT